MAWKFRRFKIKWNKKKGKFLKRKINRQASRKASLRWRRNRGKMRAALRKARRKGKITMRRNKSRGIFRKLKVARKRFKNILKSDVDMSMFVDSLLNESTIRLPEIEIDREIDLDDISNTLKDMFSDVESELEEKENMKEFIEHALAVLEDLKDVDEEDLSDEEKDQISDILDMIDDYAAACGEYDDDDYGYEELEDDHDYHDSNYDAEEDSDLRIFI